MTENTIALESNIASETQQSIHSAMLKDDEISLLDLLQVVADNLRLLVLGPLLAGLIVLGYSFTILPVFTATTKFLPPQQQQSSASSMLQSLGALGSLASAAGGIKNPADQYVVFLKSQSIKDALIDRFNLLDRYKTKSRENASMLLSRSVQIVSSKDGFITIYASNNDSVFAAQLANAHVDELSKLMSRLAVTEAQQRRLFFEKQLIKAKENLVKAERELKGGGVNSNALKVDPKAAVEGLARLKAAISAQEIKLGAMRGYFAESAPDLKQALTELAAMRSQLLIAEKAELTVNVSAGDSDYVGRYRNFKYSETLFEIFSKQFEIARVDESREGPLIQVLDIAHPAERKSSPKKAALALQTTLAVEFFLLLFVFSRQSLRTARQAPKTAVKLRRLRQALARAIGFH